MNKSVDDLLAEARALLPSRLSPEAAARAQADGAILIDIRGDDQIRIGGSIPTALEIPRNVLEWRCDPSSRWRHPAIWGLDQQLILICEEGFQSSLAAACLQQLGFASATDVDGGFVAWKASGLPVNDPSVGRHWDEVHTRVPPDKVSWHQPASLASLKFIDTLNLPSESAIIDVGGGTSALAAALLTRGFTDVTVLDASLAALRISAQHSDQGGVRYLHRDVLHWVPDRPYDLWHDRALFHFLVQEVIRRQYVGVLKSALPIGGSVIISTFAEDGPKQCSGLPTAGLSFSRLAAVFGSDFCVTDLQRLEHQTPDGKVQPFNWLVLRRLH